MKLRDKSLGLSLELFHCKCADIFLSGYMNLMKLCCKYNKKLTIILLYSNILYRKEKRLGNQRWIFDFSY